MVVALNRFTADTDRELDLVKAAVAAQGAAIALTEVWAKGGEGGLELADRVLEALEKGDSYRRLYDWNLPLAEKIRTVATRVYGADGVVIEEGAAKTLKELESLGYGNLPVCMAKTQMSLSDRPELKGRPRGFEVHVREVRLSAGAGFVVAICGPIMTMPGLPKSPAAERIDMDAEGRISGLF